MLLAGHTVTGWTSVIASILFLSGIQLIVLGIIGEYLGKLFMENKRRPNYIIEKTSIKNNNNKTKTGDERTFAGEHLETAL